MFASAKTSKKCISGGFVFEDFFYQIQTMTSFENR
jgi:hypothetical protein